jgi:thiamine-phosphate pyrophosphorylase
MNAKRGPPSFVGLSPGDLVASSAHEFAQRVRAALSAGLPGLLLREPGLSDRDFLSLARELAARSHERGAWFCVHDRVHVAVEVGADAVHLGFRSLPPDAARELLPLSMALGISTHEGDELALFEGCDYRIHGPVFDTPSKRGIKSPIGLEGVARAVQLSKIPLLAIGGLKPEHFASLRELGAHGACARGAMFEAGDSLLETSRKVEGWLSVSGEPHQ